MAQPDGLRHNRSLDTETQLQVAASPRGLRSGQLQPRCYHMSYPRKYLLALLPAAITVGLWQLAWLAFNVFGCDGDIKHMQYCFAGPINLLPFMGFGLFWMQLASLITVPVSALMPLFVGSRHIGFHNGASES